MSKFLVLPLLICSLFLTGCGGAKIPGLVSAEGIVLLDGQPVEGVSIVFTPASGSGNDRYAIAVSENGGKFVLTTSGIRGAMPGKYMVSLSKTTAKPTVSPEEEARLNDAGLPVPTETTYHIPWKYENAQLSGLETEIAEKGNKEIRLEMQPDNTPLPKQPLI